MQEINELMRIPAPAPRPQSLACDGETLWLGSIETSRLYQMDVAHWTVREEAAAPGKPWGMTVTGDELRVICGEGADDHRYIRRYIPGHGFKAEGAIPCPEDTGSQLAYDGDRLYVSQWYNKRILSIDDEGTVGSEIPLPRGVCGQVVVNGCFFVLNTDDEDSDAYFVTRVDARTIDSPKTEDVARIRFPARALAFDGTRFWTNHREAHEVVAFTVEGLSV